MSCVPSQIPREQFALRRIAFFAFLQTETSRPSHGKDLVGHTASCTQDTSFIYSKKASQEVCSSGALLTSSLRSFGSCPLPLPPSPNHEAVHPCAPALRPPCVHCGESDFFPLIWESFSVPSRRSPPVHAPLEAAELVCSKCFVTPGRSLMEMHVITIKSMSITIV